MPSDASDGYEGIGRRKPRRRKPKPAPKPVTGSRGDSPSERKAPTPSGRHRTPKPPATPPADVKSERDLRRGEPHKKTKPYRGAIREAYTSRPVAERRKRAKRAKERKTYFDQVIAKTHKDRIDRLRELRRSAAKHDVVTDRDLKTARRYLEEHGPKLSTGQKERARLIQLEEEGKLKPGRFLDKLAQAPASLAMRPAAIAVATAHDPVGVPVKTAKGTLKAIKGAPGAIVSTVKDPKGELSKAAEEFADRGSQKFGETVKRIRKEGATADIADVMVAVPAGGAAAKALRVEAKERPVKRVSGNVRRPQRASRGLVVRTAQGQVDKRRARRAERQLQRAEAGGPPIAPEIEAAALANRAAGRVVEVPASRAARRRGQRRAVAQTKSRGVQRLKLEQTRVVRQAARRINRLSKHERRALYYIGAGIAPAERGGFEKALAERAERITAKRDEEGVQPKGLLKRTDELKAIEQVVAGADKIDFGKLKGVTKELRDLTIKVGREDPGLTAGQRLHRRYAQQAEVLGLRQGELPEGRKLYHGSAEGPDAILKHGLQVRTPKIMEGKDVVDDAPGVYLADKPELAAVYGRYIYEIDEDKLAAALAQDDHGGPGAFRSSDRIPPEAIRYVGKKGEFDDSLLKQLDRERSVPKLRYFDEPTADYIRRVQRAADEARLERPLYFPSERYSLDADPDYSAHAVGGQHMGRRPFRYEGRNFQLGLQDTDPQVLLHGIARNIKRKHNWNLVAKTFNEHTFDGLRNMTVKQLRRTMAERGIDISEVAFWNPGVYNRRVAEEIDSDTAAHRTELEELRTGAPEEFGMDRVANVLTDSAMTLDRAAQHPDANMKGWSVVPRAAYDEIMASARPSGFVGRTADIGKQKASRFILGSLNLPWLQYQVASNALLTGLAGAGPVSAVRAQVYWAKLKPEEREAMNALLGSGSFSDTLQRTHVGAADAGPLQGIVNAYRGLKKAEIWDKTHLRQLNPLEAMFRMDRAQNDFFRRTVLYNRQRKEAFKRMGENMGLVDRMQNRITNIMALDPGDQIAALRRDPDMLERHADAVNEWLGDYTTFTHRERMTLQRFVMFYGFMRFSLNFTFYTMPVNHPLMTGIITNLGQLESEEIDKLFGGNAPPWAEGKFYFEDDGQLMAVPLAKANPALNAVAELRHPAQIVTVAPPYVSLIAEQLVNKNLFAGRDWRTEGKAAPYAANFKDFPMEERARIAADDLMSMLFPYRMAETLTQEGPQGDDSLLWDARPTKFKKKEAKRGIKKDIAHEQAEESFIREIIPMLPQKAGRDVERHQEMEAAKREKPKEGKKPKPFGASGGSKGSFGARP